MVNDNDNNLIKPALPIPLPMVGNKDHDEDEKGSISTEKTNLFIPALQNPPLPKVGNQDHDGYDLGSISTEKPFFGDERLKVMDDGNCVDMTLFQFNQESTFYDGLRDDIAPFWESLAKREIGGTHREKRAQIILIHGKNYWSTADKTDEMSFESGVDSIAIRNKVTMNDPKSLRNATEFLCSFFQNDGATEELKIREQLLMGFSIFLYDGKGGGFSLNGSKATTSLNGSKATTSLNGPKAACDIIGGCTFFPGYGKGAYIGYVGISRGSYTQLQWGTKALN